MKKVALNKVMIKDSVTGDVYELCIDNGVLSIAKTVIKQ